MAKGSHQGGHEPADGVLTGWFWWTPPTEPDEIGTMFDVYDGRKRRSTEPRRIGFTARWDMPQVGAKKFPYTKAGEKAAKKEAKMSGKQMKIAKRMKSAR